MIDSVSASTAYDQILAARDRMSRAIAERDLSAIAACLQPAYCVVTARSMHRDGRDASMKSWSDLFAHDPSATYSRTPQDIHINEGWGMAQEHGRWTATVSSAQGLLEIAGVYAAKWHYGDAEWRLEAEIFTPLTIEPAGSIRFTPE